MARKFADQGAPARKWLAVTPSDTDNLPAGVNSLYVTDAGDLALVGSDGNVEVFAADAGSIVPLAPIRVNATATTAAGIIALY